MNFLRNFRIRTRLLLNSGLLLFLFVGALFIYQYTLKHTEVVFQQVLENEHSVADEIVTIDGLFWRCRKQENKFLLLKNIADAEIVFQKIKIILEKARGIKTYAEKIGKPDIALLTEEIAANIGAYEKAFQKIVDGHVRKGLTEEQGLQGEFRNAAHDLLNVHLVEHDVGELLLSLMNQRRFIHDRGGKGMENLSGEMANFEKLFYKFSGTGEHVETLRSKFLVYQNAQKEFIAAGSSGKNIAALERVNQLEVDLESALQSLYVPNVIAQALQIRRHEKDYLLRGDIKYAEETRREVADLTQRIKSSAGLKQKDIDETTAFLSIYLSKFDELVEEDRKIGLAQADVQKSSDMVAQIVEKIEKVTRKMTAEDMALTKENFQLASSIAMTICLTAILLGVFFSLWITNSITLPLKTILDGLSQMTGGKYSIRIAAKEFDTTETGVLARMFNQMAVTIEKNYWLSSGRNILAEQLREDKEENRLCRDILVFLAEYLNAQVGAIYVQHGENTLRLAESYSYSGTRKIPAVIRYDEGVVGEVARSRKRLLLTELPEDYLKIESGLGVTLPRVIIAVPAIWLGSVQAVVELASLSPFSDDQIEFLDMVTEPIAIAIHSTRQRTQTMALLLETQQQAEELQTQQEELRTANEELAEYTQTLRQSEEELRSQQEELQASNEELEEKSDSLERQNYSVNEKNRELEIAWAEIDSKAKELESSSRYKSEFLANMSHELRTPLNSLLLLSRNLAKNKDGNLDDGQVESANIIYNSGEDLLSLINDILDLSKIEAGQMDVAADTIGIRGFADWLNSNFQHMAKDSRIELSMVISPDLRKNLVSDRKRLEQIMRNLVGNAIKFTDEGQVTVTFTRPDAGVDLSASGLDGNSGLAIVVKDTGIGISPDMQPIVFDAFKQVDGGTSRRYGGTGLGLSISEKLARLLGGEIQLVSEIGKGSTFTLYLPFEPDTGETVNAALQAEEQPKAPQPSVLPERPEIPKIPDDRKNIGKDDKVMLIIEDDLNFARILMGLGHEKGFKCLATASGLDGLDLAERYKVGGIILDIRLPDISGWEVLDTLKKSPSLRHIPVHMMSGEEKTIEAFKKGAMGFLTKPISEADLQKAFEGIEDVLSCRMRDLLIVEDDKIMVQAITTLIGTNDVTITTASTGEKAIEEIKKRKIDCMILDIGLPDMSGFTLLERLESEADVEIPPVIVYTGRELTKAEGSALLKYTDTVIIKGVKSEERLLDETSLFLHRVISDMPTEKRQMIASLYDQDAMFKDKKILVVDDDMRNAFALSKILEERGMEIIIAHDGAHALQLLEKTGAVDIVLMDIMMPVMDGYETTKRIRAQKKFWDLPIIALTANAMSQDKEKCMSAGASDYLAKPVEENRLLSMMRVWLYR